MASHHRVSIFVLVGVVALISLVAFFFGSPTGMAPGKSNYLTTSVGQGEDVAIEAAKVCYPKKDDFHTYRECCDQPCRDECKAQEPIGDIRACQMVCEQECIKIVTAVYLERKVGFVSTTSMGAGSKQYVVYEK